MTSATTSQDGALQCQDNSTATTFAYSLMNSQITQESWQLNHGGYTT